MTCACLFIAAQPPQYRPYSIAAEVGYGPCVDSIGFLFFKRTYDLSRIFPEWLPVIDYDYVAEVEGTVIARSQEELGCEISAIDFPPYHFTHDFTINPFSYPTFDNRYTNLLARRVYYDSLGRPIDTIDQKYLHIEWESGLAAHNPGNPCSSFNRKGKSCGFFSHGHEKGDVIWNWPTLGDWVHVEGAWIWDRGHPPARTEIHPARFIAIRRHLPEIIHSEQGDRWATRIDLFASGDGGALLNNREGMPDFVQPVRMSAKDYIVKVKTILPKSTTDAVLKVESLIRPGDDFPGSPQVQIDDSFATISIPWRSLPDSHHLARTYYLYWDPATVINEDKVRTCEVRLEELRFLQSKEFLTREEYRIFFNVGSDWLFLNDLTKGNDQLRGGIGRTWKKRFVLNTRFRVHVLPHDSFRVHVGGFEADGISRGFGHLLDPASPCDEQTLQALHKILWGGTIVGFRECWDDHIGHVNVFVSHDDSEMESTFEVRSQGKWIDEDCLRPRGQQVDVFSLTYRVRWSTNLPK